MKKTTIKTLIKLCSLVVLTIPAHAGVISGPIVSPVNRHTYYLLSQNTWTASEAEAVTLGGHLATVRSLDENSWIFSQFSQFGGTDRGLWIGLNDAAQEGTYVWASGEAVSYLHWASGEPRNENGLDDYVHLFYPSDTSGRASFWNDAPNDFSVFLTEINGVVEVLPPTLSIRVSQVELCWQTATNTWYQLQYRSTLTTNQWLPLSASWVAGNGTRFCTTDAIVVGSPQRFYQLSVTNSPPQ